LARGLRFAHGLLPRIAQMAVQGRPLPRYKPRLDFFALQQAQANPA
jgi:hypothetical protein